MKKIIAVFLFVGLFDSAYSASSVRYIPQRVRPISVNNSQVTAKYPNRHSSVLYAPRVRIYR